MALPVASKDIIIAVEDHAQQPTTGMFVPPREALDVVLDLLHGMASVAVAQVRAQGTGRLVLDDHAVVDRIGPPGGQGILFAQGEVYPQPTGHLFDVPCDTGAKLSLIAAGLDGSLNPGREGDSFVLDEAVGHLSGGHSTRPFRGIWAVSSLLC